MYLKWVKVQLLSILLLVVNVSLAVQNRSIVHMGILIVMELTPEDSNINLFSNLDQNHF